MKFKTAFIILATAAGIVWCAFIVVSHRATDTLPSAPRPIAKSATSVTAEPVIVLAKAKSNSSTSPLTPTGPSAESNTAAQPELPADAAAAASQPLTINGYVVQDPDARAALALVGKDPEAEAYWAQAVNDPTLPANERKDLIEDLNQDGLSNPRHPTADDMSIIEYRIQLIEDMSSDAMDQANADAFAEAYKDLVNLYNRQPAN